MSSAVISTSAALSRPFVFDAEPAPEVYSPFAVSKKPARQAQEAVIASVLQSKIGNRQAISLAPASRLAIRLAPEMASSGIASLDSLTGGLPRGCLTEICGSASSGRTSVMLAALAAATRRGEYCAVIDTSDALDPHSTADAGIDLDRLLWVRCGDDSPRKQNSPQRHPSAALRAGSDTEKSFKEKSREQKEVQTVNRRIENRLEQVLRATDLLLESGGFGLIVLDLADLPAQAARRIPLTTWFRFRRAVEHKPTILLAIEQQPIAGSCSSLLLRLGARAFSCKPISLAQSSASRQAAAWESPARQCRVEPGKKNESRRDGTLMEDTAKPRHACLLTGLEINAELICSRLERKPARSITFESQTAWAG